MDLIIVESPTKAKTLTKFLKGKYAVMATMGHIRDLPKGDFGVDVEKGFAPSYVTPRDKMPRVKELVDAAKKADHVILATDPDREGEAIAWHVGTIITHKTKSEKDISSYARIVFHEITESAINEALKNPRSIDMPLVDAQQARRILDRIVGYKLSPLLWKKLSRRWLSAGRVQSVAVRLVVEREREIGKFDKKPYFTIEGTFSHEDGKEEAITAELISKNGVKYQETLSFELFDGKYTTSKTSIGSEDEAKNVCADFSGPFVISAVDKKEIKRSPTAPFTTSTLQQEASRKLYFSAKKTMQVAQKLYEEGHITYHRTDSVNLAEKYVEEARAFIRKEYGQTYIPANPRIFHTKSKVAQEAHEAIRPTNLSVNESTLTSDEGLNRDHVRLYDLIWKRALACQASDALFDSTTIVILSANGYRFETQGSIVKFDGFLKITGHDAGDKVIPSVVVGEALVLSSTNPVAHETQSPPRYSEATLVKTLEEKDIGRPSTYAPIISTIIDRNYVVKEEKKLVPTDLGNSVTDFLVQYFPTILSLPFTQAMEASFDEIANGAKKWEPVIADFYGPFAEQLEKTYTQAERVKMAEEILEEKCPECGNFLVIRIGKFGKFVACTKFPECTYTRQHVEKIDIKCPKCGGDVVIKKSRKGKMFFGCGNYPKCTFAAWKKEDIK
jgi:DNA topoisomerase I